LPRSRANGSDALVFSNAADGFVIYARPNASMVSRTTNDGGHSWAAPVRRPCGRYTRVGVAPDGAIWLACASEPVGGRQGHLILVSTDGGRTFKRRGEGAIPGSPGVSPRGNIGGAGYLHDLDPVSATTAYIELYRAGLRRSRNGGTHWRTLRPFAFGDGAQFGGTSAVGRNVWEAHTGLGLFHSSDFGVTWRRILR